MDKKEISLKFFETIPKLMHLVRSEVRAVTSPGLTIPQFRVLANLNRGLNKVGEIAEHQGVSQPAMSKIIDGLVKRNLIRRQPSLNDRRAIDLAFTAEGRALFLKVKKTASKNFQKNLENISAKDLEALDQAMNSLKKLVIKIEKNK
jgi:MarR family transcriptional regulator for hemolysin